MDNTVEKVICLDRPHDNSALCAAMCNNRNNDPMAMAAMMGGGFGANQWMNNPFAYMMMMAWMRNFNDWGNNGYGGVQGVEIQSQLDAIRSQLNDNQNITLLRDAIGDGFQRNDFALSQLAQNLNVDFNTLQKCCCEVQAAIQGVAGQVGFSAERVINAANMGDCRIIEALKDCCCQNKELVQRMGYETRLGLKDNAFATERGFCALGREVQFGFDRTNTAIERAASSLGFQGQQDKCDIVNAINAAQQRTADLLNGHWSQEMQLKIQDLKGQLDNRDQTDAIIARLTGGCGCNKGCGCNNNRYSGF